MNILSVCQLVNYPRECSKMLYCTYMRPVLENASEVWNGCNITRLEQVQLNATRIVTGLSIFFFLAVTLS